MGAWHWYCPRHGAIDRVDVTRRGGTTIGRCRRCGAVATWAKESSAPTPKPGSQACQLRLFKDRR
jgi:hypothetical protein